MPKKEFGFSAKIMYKHERARQNISFKAFRFLAVCVFLTAFVVLFSVAVSVADGQKNANLTEEYDKIILPVVMQDPAPFGENVPPDPDMMMGAAVWDAAMKYKDNDNFRDENQNLVLEKGLVNESLIKLFGKNSLENSCGYNNSNFYFFDSSENKFIIKAISGVNNFSPHTVSARSDGENIFLKVGYVVPADEFEPDMTPRAECRVEKYATYMLKSRECGNLPYVAAVM